ncbi:MAG: hypothetical protein Q8L64_03290 [bacterium]|nr:hypothetical protein [bacterium]
MNVKEISIAVIALAVLAGIAGVARVAFAPEVVSESGTEGEVISVPRVLEGRVTCLPHRDRAGPQTLECALGLETDAGEFYALDGSDLEPNAIIALDQSERIRANGHTVPIQAVSSNFWFKYDILGIMRVESVEILK